MGCLCSKPPAEEESTEIEIVPTKIPEHTRNLSTHYTVHFPDHEARKASSIYAKTHRQMKHLECFICGKTNEKDGIHVETHHFYCEKSLQNAFDWEKFGKFADNCHNFYTGEPLAKFDWKEVALNPDLFVDSPHNMIVLCKEHHTSGNRGIHHVPFPEWIAQKFVKDGFVVLS